jgi:hypothetical protein
MVRGLVITLAAFGLAGAAAAQSDGASNPFDVTWAVGAPTVVDPLPFSLNGRVDFEIAPLSLHMRLNGVDPGPTLADDIWGGESRFPACNIHDPACADELPAAFGLRLRSDGSGGVKFGALVRLGESLSAPRATSKNSWRFFAAADAHAVTWDLNRNDGETFRVEDLLTLGDAQVGIARPLAGGDLAFGFIHREVSVEGASRNEQYGGVTFTLER